MNKRVIQELERSRLRDTFARFLPESMVDQVVVSGDSDIRLGGVRLIGTALFTDLRGFTTFAEKRPPDEVIEVLNRYLGEMSDAVLDHGGTLVAYMGDGLMAVFGAPVESEDHADRALRAAGEMLRERLPRFNEWLHSSGDRKRFAMGVGVCSGPMMSGNVGSERRLEYAAIGDTVNTASRLESLTKEFPYQRRRRPLRSRSLHQLQGCPGHRRVPVVARAQRGDRGRGVAVRGVRPGAQARAPDRPHRPGRGAAGEYGIYALARRIVKPILAITRTATAVTAGDLTQARP